MRKLLLILLVGINLSPNLQAAGKTADLGGTWILDPDKSEIDFSPPGRRNIDLQVGIGGPTVQSQPNEGQEDIGIDPSENIAETKMKDLTLQIEQTMKEMQVTRNFTMEGKEKSVLQIFFLDGSRCINPPSDGLGDVVSRVAWEKGKLVNEGTETEGSGIWKTESSLEEEYSISKKGKRLTIKTRKISTKGIIKIKLVFHKQQNTE